MRQINQKNIVQYQVADRNIRLKLTSKCQWSCHFCHMEGLHGSPDLSWDIVTAEKILRLANNFNRTKIHLTGGEPTSYPQILEVIEYFFLANFDISITTNGQFSTQKLQNMIDYGCREFTFSFPTLETTEFINMNNKKFSEPRAVSNLQNIKTNLAYLQKQNIPCDVNIVFSKEIENRNSVFDYCILNDININLLDVIGDLEDSQMRILRFLETKSFTPFEMRRVKGTSRTKFVFKSNDSNQTVSVKYFEPFFLNSMCGDCSMKSKCDEKFYGIRVEMAMNGLMVRTCIHRSVLTEIDKFVTSQIGMEILKQN